MGKRSYIPVIQNNKKLKVFIDDVKKIFKAPKKSTPSLPSYDRMQVRKWDEVTDFEFEALDICLK